MAYNQIYALVNSATKQALGATAITACDTTSLAQVGGQILTSENPHTFEIFMNGLCGVIAKTRIKSKKYNPFEKYTTYRNSDDFGLFLRKIQRTNIKDVGENSSYKSQDWDYYDGSLSVNWTDRIFGTYGGFETEPVIKSYKQLSKCFHNPAEMAEFITMLDDGMFNDMSCHLESTEMLARATAIGSCFASTNTAVDLGAIYNTLTGKATSKSNWWYDADLMRFMIVEIKRILSRLKTMNRIYNNEGADRFTRDNELIIDVHSDFVAGMNGFLENTLIEKFIDMPTFNEVSRWQAIGTSVSATDTHKISIENDNLNVNTTAFASYTTDGTDIAIDGIVAFARDIEKVATNIGDDLRTVSATNNLQEMVTSVTKYDCGYAIDPSEQGIVFYVGDHSAT